MMGMAGPPGDAGVDGPRGPRGKHQFKPMNCLNAPISKFLHSNILVLVDDAGILR